LSFARRSLAVIPVLMMIVLMLAGGATRTVHAAQWPSPHGGLPGTPIGGAQPNRAIFLVFNENGTLITLPFQSIPGDLVLCESACQEDPSSWSDVLRFCDTPLNDAACQSATTTTHAQLFTGGRGQSQASLTNSLSTPSTQVNCRPMSSASTKVLLVQPFSKLPPLELSP
jgi:hypothetical protein